MFVASEIDLLVSVSVVARPTNVSVASGRVSVRSAVGSTRVRVVSKSLFVAPSKTKAFLTAIVVESIVVVVP